MYDKCGALMEVGFARTMGKSPVGFLSVAVEENRAERRLQWRRVRHQAGERKGCDESQSAGGGGDFDSYLKAGCLGHTVAIAREAIDIPAVIRAEIDFDVTLVSGNGEEALETGAAP